MIQLFTFGGLRLETESGVHVQRMRLGLLAVVAACGEIGITRERLIALLWPESDETRGRGALKQAIHALRRDLSQPDLFLGVDTLRLNPKIISSDVAEFDTAFRIGDLERAVTMYRGKFLHGFHVPNVEFEEWQFGEQARLARRYQQALEHLARSAERDGDFSASVHWWQTLAEHDPASAPVALSLMRALERAGDRTGAIRHAEVHAAHVYATLQTNADDEVLELAENLRRKIADIAPEERNAVHLRSPTEVRPESSSSQTEVEGSHLPTYPRWKRLAIAAIGAGALVIALPPFRAYDPAAVQLRIDGEGGTSVHALLRTKVEAAMLRGVPDMHVGSVWYKRARVEAEIRSEHEGDSVLLSAQVHDRLTSERFSIGPIVSLSRVSAAAALGEHIAVAIAATRSPVTQRWSAKAALPHTVDGFRIFEAALSEWRPPFNRFPKESLDSLKRAYTLDTTSGATIALHALILIKHGHFAPADSMLARLERPDVRKKAWERGVADVIRAWQASDLVRAHRAGHKLLDSVPRSEWAVILAYDALGLGYADEAVALLTQTSPLVGLNGDTLSREATDRATPEAITAWQLLTLGQAYYHLGDFARAFDVARIMLARNPEVNIGVQAEIKALAGLGRDQDVEQVCRRVLARSRGIQECQQAMIELRGRGHLDAARRVAAAVMESLVASDSLTSRELDEWRAFFATRVGDWNTAGRLLQTMSWDDLGKAEMRAEWLMVLASRGDTARIRTLTARLEQPLDIWTRAQLAAMAGDKARATELVAEGFRQGRRRNITLFVFPGLQPLTDYTPFQRLIRPLSMTDHVNAVAQTAAATATDRR